MSNGREQQLPVARSERLLIEKLPDEVLVYDLDRKKAHCLNRTAALIWNQCDGKTSIRDMVKMLQKHSDGKIEEEVVWFGLNQLQKARLLEVHVEKSNGEARLSRRELVKQIGLAVSIPTVVSILAPTASAATSCVGKNCVGQPGICGSCTCNGTQCV